MGKNGGARPGAGRKPKADEIALIERLSPMDDTAFSALEAGVEKGDYNYIKMFFEYRFGKPNQTTTLNLDEELVKQYILKGANKGNRNK